jgi:hypothetical protein
LRDLAAEWGEAWPELRADLARHGLPGEYRLLATDGEVDFGLAYKIEGRRILTDEAAPLAILYIARNEDPAQYDALLIDAIAARLALDAAYPLAGSVSLAQAMSQAYAEKLAEARQVDAQEGSPDALVAGDWLESRF